MILTVGNKVVYPCQGPCLIGPIVKKIINDRSMMFHQLTVLGNGGGELFIPVEHVPTIGIRPLLEKSEITKLLAQLSKPGKVALTLRQRFVDNIGWRQRYVDSIRLFASGSAFDLAEIIESLTGLNEVRSLSVNDRKRLDRAKKLLVCEISEVMDVTEQEAELLVEHALREGKEEVIEGDLSGACNQNEAHKEVAELGIENRRVKAQGA